MKKIVGKSLAILALLILSNSLFGQEEKNESAFKVGGLLRYNFGFSQYENPMTPASGYATIDTWGVNAKGSAHGIDLDFEYRFYPTSGTHFIHHGYFGYEANESLYLKAGVFQKPFGIGKFASHSFWFQGPYYVGLEDDYDIGIGFDYELSDNFKIELSYFRQSEPEGPKFGGDVTFGNSGPGRYSYDITTGRVVTTDSAVYNESIRELNTGNLRLTYQLSDAIELGLSAQAGGIYHDMLQTVEFSGAFAGHVLAEFNRISLKTEYIYYNYNARGAKIANNGDVSTYQMDCVQMGAYGFDYQIASEAQMYIAGIAYTIPLEWGPIESVQAYVDFTYFDKSNPDFVDSYHLIPGALVTAGNLYCFADFALGKNHSWLTDDFGVGFEQGRLYTNDPDKSDMYYYTEDAALVGTGVPLSEMPWNLRFNVNLGYYF